MTWNMFVNAIVISQMRSITEAPSQSDYSEDQLSRTLNNVSGNIIGPAVLFTEGRTYVLLK